LGLRGGLHWRHDRLDPLALAPKEGQIRPNSH